MAPFRFRLDKVLRLRRHELETARRQFQNAVAAEQAAEQALLALRAEMAARVAGALSREAGGMTALAFAVHRRHLAHLQEQAQQAEAAWLAARAEAARRRQALVLTRRRERVLERLRELRLAQHSGEAQQQELARLDELAVQARARPPGETDG